MRINELARELEVKAKSVLDYLASLGITDKRSHSSSIEDDIAEKVRRHFGQGGEGAALAGEEKAGAPAEAVHEAPHAEAPPEAAHAPEPPRLVATPAAAPPPPSAVRPAVPLTTGRRSVLRPPVRPHAPAPPSAVPAEPVPPAVQAPPPAAPVASAPPTIEAEPAPPPPPATAQEPRVPPRGPEVRPPMPPPQQQPEGSRFVVQGRLTTPRQGVPGPVSRAGAPAPNVARLGPQVSPPTRPAVPPRALAPGQPIYQPRSGRPAPPTRAGTAARPGAPSAGGLGTPGRPGRPVRPAGPVGAAPGQAGRFERRPMHPTRARPVVGPGAPPPPPGGERRPAPRPAVPTRDREREIRSGPPRMGPAPFIPREVDREVTITEGITVKDLAEKLGVKARDLMQRLITRGIFATINHALDMQAALQVSRDFGAEARVISFEQESQEAAASVEETVVEEGGQVVTRPPVVTIMGHVDHGKTSLLDAIRRSRVTEQEAGGITQHIGAYQVEINGRKITFIDTPGHEAFTRMRARGAKVTDIVVLVVAADDGVMPQTLEAIDHARAAGVPIVVAVNKIDKPDAQPERVKRQLSDRGLMPEDWGGQTVTVEVSAKQKTHLDTLLEMILLVADMQELKATPSRPAMATVLEAELDKGRGPVATVLVQNGTLRPGDPFIVGPVFGKVRALLDDLGRPIEEAGPSTPVQVLGLSSLPSSGDQFQVVTDIGKSKQIANFREQKAREAALARSARLTLDKLHEQLQAGAVKELNIVLKADVHGSAEVLGDTMTKLSNEQVKVKVLRSGVGAINESDVLLASASNAVIIGFNVRPERNAEEMADQEKVDIRLHTIIYDLVDEMKKAMVGLLEPTIREVHLGRAAVRDVFRVPKVGAVAGCMVEEGRLTRSALVRLLRDNVVIYTGRVASLRRFKEDASEVRAGFECGVALENYSDIKLGDVIEAFVTEKVAAEMLA